MLNSSDFKLLLVDDQPKNIQVLANILSTEGYQIEYVTNGNDAVNWVVDEAFDLILLDVMMPEMDGFTVCTKIKELPINATIPIIFITAKNDIESITKGFSIGGVDYITKPFNGQELLARVRTHLDLKKHKDKLEELVDLRTQELQNAYKELEILDVAKGEFLTMLSHEIRTPLNGILGFLNILKSKALTSDIKKLLGHLDQSAKRLEDFSLKALIITELRAKKCELSIIDAKADVLIMNALEVFEIEINNNSIGIDTSLPSTDIIIKVDLKLFSLSLEEIIRNILIHSPKTSKISIHVINDNSQTRIEISDNGNGFSEMALTSLFQPFGYGQEHINNKIGLGLHLVKLIMDAHKAEIFAGNNSDEGAYVHILLNKMN